MSIVLPVLTGIGSRGFVEFSSPFKSNGTQHLSWSGGPGVHNDGPQRGRAHRRSQLASVAASMEHGMEAPIRCARIHFSRTPSLDPLLPCVA